MNRNNGKSKFLNTIMSRSAVGEKAEAKTSTKQLFEKQKTPRGQKSPGKSGLAKEEFFGNIDLTAIADGAVVPEVDEEFLAIANPT